MLTHIIKTAWRNIIRQRAHSLLNIAGLAVSFAAAFLIMLWIVDELKFDAFHANGPRLFRVLGN